MPPYQLGFGMIAEHSIQLDDQPVNVAEPGFRTSMSIRASVSRLDMESS
jgi:hypothetical protein